MGFIYGIKYIFSRKSAENLLPNYCDPDYARVTAIAVFAHDAADTANRVPGAGDEQGWAALAGELGYLDLQALESDKGGWNYSQFLYHDFYISQGIFQDAPCQIEHFQ